MALNNRMNTVFIKVDGSWNQNSHVMGCGAVIPDFTGRWMSGIFSSFGPGNAFTVELMALEIGLEHAWELGFRQVVCGSECTEVIAAVCTTIDVNSLWDRD